MSIPIIRSDNAKAAATFNLANEHVAELMIKTVSNMNFSGKQYEFFRQNILPNMASI